MGDGHRREGHQRLENVLGFCDNVQKCITWNSLHSGGVWRKHARRCKNCQYIWRTYASPELTLQLLDAFGILAMLFETLVHFRWTYPSILLLSTLCLSSRTAGKRSSTAMLFSCEEIGIEVSSCHTWAFRPLPAAIQDLAQHP